MLTVTELTALCRKYLLAATRGRPQFAAISMRYWWPVFVSMLGLALITLSGQDVPLLRQLMLILLLILLGWFARQWLELQLSVVAVVVLTIFAKYTNSADLIIDYMLPVIAVLLTMGLLLMLLNDSGKLTIPYRYLRYLYWSVLIGTVLCLLMHSVVRPATGLYYAGLPLTNREEFLLGTAVVMLFLYLQLRRTYSRIQADYIWLVPVTLLVFYITLNDSDRHIVQQIMPAIVLEHSLLLVHVPSMSIAFALLLNASGLALLRILSDQPWFRRQQNMDILETVQSRVEDYLYRMLNLAIVILGIGLLSGMWWSNLTWGHYWHTEPKQVMSLAVWLYYVAGLHFRLQKGMQTRPFAWWCLAGLPIIILALLGTDLWAQGLHNFST